MNRTCKSTVFIVHWSRFFLNTTRHIERNQRRYFRRWCAIWINSNINITQNAGVLYSPGLVFCECTGKTVRSLRKHAIPERFWGDDSRRGAISPFTFTFSLSACSDGVKDMTHEAKAKAKDYRNCPRGSSRPRTCPGGLHHWLFGGSKCLLHVRCRGKRTSTLPCGAGCITNGVGTQGFGHVGS